MGGRCGWFFVANNMQTLRLNEQRKLFKSLSQRKDGEREGGAGAEVPLERGGGRSLSLFAYVAFCVDQNKQVLQLAVITR